MAPPAPAGTGSQPDDAALVARVRAGDHGAFALLVRRHVRSATLLAAQLVGDRDDAEDVVQDAFVVLYRRMAEFESGRSVGPWLFGIVRHLAVRRRATRVRRRKLWERWAAWRASEREEHSVDAQVEAGLQLRQAGDVLATLPSMQRACFELVVIRELSVVDVAEMHDITESTVRQHVFRARRALRRALREES